MNDNSNRSDPVTQAAPLGAAAATELGSEQLAEGLRSESLNRMPWRQIFPILVAQLALYVAFVAPSAFSLAIRVQEIAPQSKDVVLALAIGIPGIAVIFVTPFIGVLSDRTRSRLGRRRPWIIAGLLLGLIGSAIIGTVPNAAVLIVGWVVAYIGYTAIGLMILAHFGDRLPEAQRGKIMGINGALTQIGPILGIVVAGAFTSTPALMFLIPGAIAFLGGIFFVIVMKDPLPEAEGPRIALKTLFEGFYFNPRRYSNLGWVWLSKALVFLALALMSIYSVYLLTSRLNLSTAVVAGIIATVGGAGVLVAIIGAIASGWLSDKLHTRKPFLVVSALLLGGSLVVVGTVESVPQYIIGSLIGTFAIGVYGSVDQAIQLDVLPKEEDQNGRFLSVLSLANQIPQAAGPFIAGLIVTVAAGNYSGVYYFAAGAAVLGALAIIPISVGRRAELSTTSTKVMR